MVLVTRRQAHHRLEALKLHRQQQSGSGLQQLVVMHQLGLPFQQRQPQVQQQGLHRQVLHQRVPHQVELHQTALQHRALHRTDRQNLHLVALTQASAMRRRHRRHDHPPDSPHHQLPEHPLHRLIHQGAPADPAKLLAIPEWFATLRTNQATREQPPTGPLA